MKKAARGMAQGAILAMMGLQSIVAFAQVAAAEQAQQLPGGASALSETHGDWTVNCQITNGVRLCSLNHQQFSKANGQRLLAVELVADAPDTAKGTMALPFGLALAHGIGLQVDEKPLQGPLHFDTCQAIGCLVQVTFDAVSVERLKSGATLRIDAVAADTGQPIGFNISLSGFDSALNRTAALSAD